MERVSKLGWPRCEGRLVCGGFLLGWDHLTRYPRCITVAQFCGAHSCPHKRHTTHLCPFVRRTRAAWNHDRNLTHPQPPPKSLYTYFVPSDYYHASSKKKLSSTPESQTPATGNTSKTLCKQTAPISTTPNPNPSIHPDQPSDGPRFHPSSPSPPSAKQPRKQPHKPAPWPAAEAGATPKTSPAHSKSRARYRGCSATAPRPRV